VVARGPPRVVAFAFSMIPLLWRLAADVKLFLQDQKFTSP
jgi:hypothetical protein